MKQEEFQEILKEQRGSPLIQLSSGPLSKYQHIERLGSDEVDGLLDGEVIIQNKIDGANLTVAWDPETGLFIGSRNLPIYHDGKVINEFTGAVDYVLNHEGILELVKNGWILRGEWLIRHSISYSADRLKQLYIFDCQTKDGSYIHADNYSSELVGQNVRVIPVLKRLTNPSLEELVNLVDGPDEFGATQKEGIVIKNYSFINKYGRVTWGKLVSADFKEKNKMAFGATKHDPVELKLASKCVNLELVLKTIHKIKDEKGEISIKQMPEVLGRVWYDIFSEHLWEFVKTEKVTKFDFREARRLTEKYTREFALDYFNGVEK